MNSMIKRSAILASLIGGGALALAACSSDDNKTTSPLDVDGGGGKGATGGQGGKGGTAGSSGGKGGTAGSSGGQGGSGGAKTDAGETDAGEPLAPLSGTVFVAGADFSSNSGEIAALDLTAGNVLGHVDVSDGDIALNESGGFVFAEERSGGAIDVLSTTGAIAKHIPLSTGDAGATYLNPHAVLSVSASKAYVPLNAANAIAVIDPAAGTQTGLVSLAAFLDPNDHDGSTEPEAAYYDAATHRAYFMLPRTDIFSGTDATNHVPVCPDVPSLLIAVNTDSDTIVDVNGDAGGVGIALPLVAPGYSTFDATNGKLYLASDGCNDAPDGSANRVRHGISAVTLATGDAQAVYTTTVQDFIAGFLVAGSQIYLETQDSTYASFFHPWNPGTPMTLGPALTGAPGAPVAASATTLVGYDFAATADGGSATVVKRYEIASQKTHDVGVVPFHGDYFVLNLAVMK